MEGLGALAQGFNSVASPSLAQAPAVGFQGQIAKKRLDIEEAESKRKSLEHTEQMKLLAKQLEHEGIKLDLLPKTEEEKAAFRKAEMEGKLATTEGIVADTGTKKRLLAERLPIEEVQKFARQKHEAEISGAGTAEKFTQAQIDAMRQKMAGELEPEEIQAIARDNARLDKLMREQGLEMGELQIEELRDKIASQVPPGELREYARRRLGAEALAAETGIKLTEEQIAAARHKRLSDLSPTELRYFARRSLMADIKSKETGTKLSEEQIETARKQRESMLEPARAKELAEQAMVGGIAREAAQTRDLEDKLARLPPPEFSKKLMMRSEEARAKGDEAQADLLKAQAEDAHEKAKESIRMGSPVEIARRERMAELAEKNTKAQLAVIHLQAQGLSLENTKAEKDILDLYNNVDKEMVKEVLASGAKSLDGYKGMYFEVHKTLPTAEEEAEYLQQYMTSMLSLAAVGGGNMNSREVTTIFGEWREAMKEGVITGDFSKADSFKKALFNASQISKEKTIAAASRPTGGITKPSKLNPEWAKIAQRAGVPVTATTTDSELVYEPKFREEVMQTTGQSFYRHQDGEVYILPENTGDEVFKVLGKRFDEWISDNRYDDELMAYLRANNLTPSPKSIAKYKHDVLVEARKEFNAQKGSKASISPTGGGAWLHDAIYKLAGKGRK